MSSFLYNRTTDSEIAAVPHGMDMRAVANYFGVSVKRVQAARDKFPQTERYQGARKERSEPDESSWGVDSGLLQRNAAKQGSNDLLRAQLVAHQHFFIVGQEAEYVRMCESVGLIVTDECRQKAQAA